MSERKNVFVVDLGVILPNDHKEISLYNGVYDQKRGYFDKTTSYVESRDEAIKAAKDYVKKGSDGVYGIVSTADVPADTDLKNTPVSCVMYDVESVVFSNAKIGGKIKTKFVAGAAG